MTKRAKLIDEIVLNSKDELDIYDYINLAKETTMQLRVRVINIRNYIIENSNK